jgi:hypothetical protein
MRQVFFYQDEASLMSHHFVFLGLFVDTVTTTGGDVVDDADSAAADKRSNS